MKGQDCRGRDKITAPADGCVYPTGEFMSREDIHRPLRFLAIDEAEPEPPPPPLPSYSDGACVGFVAGVVLTSVAWLAALCLGWIL